MYQCAVCHQWFVSGTPHTCFYPGWQSSTGTYSTYPTLEQIRQVVREELDRPKAKRRGKGK